MSPKPAQLIALFFLCGLVGPESSAQWPRWRGPADNGSAPRGSFPDRLDADHLLWRSALPGKGCSTPIVHGETIYVTAPQQGQDALLAIDATGRRRWSTTFGPQDPGKHRYGSGSNASPVTDGSAVFVYFKSGTLAALELDGSIRWQTNLVERFGKANLFWDHGTSPVLTDQNVIMARMHDGPSWLAAFDKKSGDLVWKVDRNYDTPTECDHGYTTPLVIRYDGREAILLWGAEHLTMHDATNGDLFWSCGQFNPGGAAMWPAIATPVIVQDMAVICYGRNDRGDPRLHGIRLSGRGDVTNSNHVWMRDDVGAFVPTPAVDHQGRVYLLRDRGEVQCLDPRTGATIWSDAFPKASKKYYASPLIAGDKLYAAREDGVVFVADLGDDRFNRVSESEMNQSVIGSPVPMSGRILIRGEKELLCFGLSEAQN